MKKQDLGVIFGITLSINVLFFLLPSTQFAASCAAVVL